MLYFPQVICAITDESERDFMKALFVKYRITMFRMARSLTTSKQDAEDVVSEACVSLIKKIPRLRQLDCNVLEGYIISTVKNTAYMLHRRKKARHEVNGEDTLLFIVDENASVDKNILQECTVQELMGAIKLLPENDQVVLRMKYFEELTDHEIAAAMNIQEVSVRSKLTRARQRIYTLLGGASNEH